MMTSSYSVTSTIITLDREYDIETLDREYDIEILKTVKGGYEDDDDNEVVILYLKISVVYDKATVTTWVVKIIHALTILCIKHNDDNADILPTYLQMIHENSVH